MAAYEILNGPSGTGVQDLFTPEINSDEPFLGASNEWTTDNALTMQYDSYKVQAVINEITGRDHSGANGLIGGYLADGNTPGPLLSRAWSTSTPRWVPWSRPSRIGIWT